MSNDRDAALALFAVSRETVARIDAFVSLLEYWQARTNLIAPSTLPNLWLLSPAERAALVRRYELYGNCDEHGELNGCGVESVVRRNLDRLSY